MTSRMKKFKFYVGGCREIDVDSANGVGNAIRGLLFGYECKELKTEFSWLLKDLSRCKKVVRITLWLSQRKLKSIVRAEINGYVDLYSDERYSPKNIIGAINRTACGTLWTDREPLEGRWFARALVEQVRGGS